MSEYGLLNRFRLYDSNSYAICCVIPSEYDMSIFGYTNYMRQFNGKYKVREYERFKQEHNLFTEEELGHGIK